VTIVHVRLAGVLALPPELTASTSKVCAPRLSDEYVLGEVHERNLYPSSEQRKLTPEVLELKPNVAVVELVLVPSAGPAVITALGPMLRPAVLPRSITPTSRRPALGDAFSTSWG
jgi:hypothetical protein